jgi:uncharacterized caspase-like protein
MDSIRYGEFVKRLLVAFALVAISIPVADAAPGKTWALLVGISNYQKLPHDLWLQYPDADAVLFGQFLESAQGGAVAAGQILLLTNEKATTAAVRAGLRGFLRDNPGKNDTVYVLIAGHGTVNNNVDNNGAYILTWDSDPENLAATALPMAELHSVVEDELNRAGRVILLADVCRAATIAGQKTTSLGGLVEKIGEAPGEMLGLMAARPKELSMESPEFGGGHGAFTWAVLQGLTGAADSDHDGFVTAGELIDFVSSDVARLTGNRQHPRDFGNMDNTTKLSDLSRPGIKLAWN